MSTTATLESYSHSQSDSISSPTSLESQVSEPVKMDIPETSDENISEVEPQIKVQENSLELSMDGSAALSSSSLPLKESSLETIHPDSVPNLDNDKKNHSERKEINLEYARELTLVVLPEELENTIAEFLKDLSAPKYAQPLTTDQVALLFQKFYTKFDEESMKYLRSNDAFDHEAIIQKIHSDYVERMEASLCGNGQIFYKIFQNNIEDLKTQIRIYEKVFILRNVVKLKIEKLDLDLKDFPSFDEEKFKSDLRPVEKMFNKINYVKSPLEKLVMISDSFESFIRLVLQYKSSDSSSPSYINADIALPMFIYFFVHKHVENLYLNFKYIRRFKNEKFWTDDSHGELAYNMTNIEALLTFIVNMDYKRDLALTDEELEKLLEEFKSEREHIKTDHFNEFKEQKSYEIPKPKHSKLAFNEKKRLIEKLEQFNDEDGNATLFDNMSLKELQSILSPMDIYFFDQAEATPPESHKTRPNGRKKSNSITFIKNTLQESLAHYQSLSPASSNSSGGTGNNKVGEDSKGLLSDAANVSSGIVLNVADQGLKNLSSVFDSSLKFIGNRIASQNSSSTSVPQHLSSNNNGNRSRSGSVNSFIANTRNRSNSTLNSLFTNANSNNVKPAEKDKLVEEGSTNLTHPLNKFMRWRGSSSALPSPSASNLSFNYDKADVSSIVNSIDSTEKSHSRSNSGTISIAKKSPRLSENGKVEAHKYKIIEKSFDDMTIAELQQLLRDYNSLVGLINENQ